jgi:hypothetical protein
LELNFIHSVGNVIIPTDELIFFRGVGLNHQPEEYVVISPAMGEIPMVISPNIIPSNQDFRRL